MPTLDDREHHTIRRDGHAALSASLERVGERPAVTDELGVVPAL